MAMVFDAYAELQSNSSGINTASVALTATGSNGLVVVCVLWAGGTQAQSDLTGVTWNGNAMTFINFSNNLTGRCFSLWYYIAGSFDGASHNVVASWGVNIDFPDINVSSYTGAKQSAQPDSSAVNNFGIVTTINMTTTTIADNCWLVSVCRGDISGFTAGTGTTKRSTATGASYGDSNAPVTPAGSNTMVWNCSPAETKGMGLIASFAPSTGGASVALPYRALMGVGK